MKIGRIGFAAAITFGVMAASASAVKIDPFRLPYSGSAQHLNAGVGFRIAGRGEAQQMKTFQFSSLVVKCKDGRHSLADQAKAHDQINANGRFTLRGHGVRNHHRRIRVHAHKVPGKHEYKGRLSIRGHWKGHGACRARTRWFANRG
jgi:hypothetical protein